jgi:hypothetical protein
MGIPQVLLLYMLDPSYLLLQKAYCLVYASQKIIANDIPSIFNLSRLNLNVYFGLMKSNYKLCPVISGFRRELY